jgi:glycolate oxidase FAD binding subunit
MTLYQPGDAAELAAIISSAATAGETLTITSGGSKRRLGRHAPTAATLDLSRITGIIDYEPAELVLTARAATPLAEIEQALAAQRQMLAFEPPDWTELLGATGAPTLGGVLACNQSGPRRLKAGAARDHFLGFSAVNGRGEIWKAGGRVVKNVTGYDMCKLQAGAFGTLSVLTEITIKVMPRPETARTLLLPVTDATAALTLMSAALNTPHEISAAAYLPATVLARSQVSAALPAGNGLVALRLEGPAPSVAHRTDALEAAFGTSARLVDGDSTTLWAEIGAVRPLLGSAEIVWRLNPTPSKAVQLLHALAGQCGSASFFMDWGGGQIWGGLEPAQAGPDAGAAAIRAALAKTGGHATLFAAPDELRTQADVFEPLPPALAALTQRIKQGFDPLDILNPRRMYKEF